SSFAPGRRSAAGRRWPFLARCADAIQIDRAPSAGLLSRNAASVRAGFEDGHRTPRQRVQWARFFTGVTGLRASLRLPLTPAWLLRLGRWRSLRVGALGEGLATHV